MSKQTLKRNGPVGMDKIRTEEAKKSLSGLAVEAFRSAVIGIGSGLSVMGPMGYYGGDNTPGVMVAMAMAGLTMAATGQLGFKVAEYINSFNEYMQESLLTKPTRVITGVGGVIAGIEIAKATFN